MFYNDFCQTKMISPISNCAILLLIPVKCEVKSSELFLSFQQYVYYTVHNEMKQCSPGPGATYKTKTQICKKKVYVYQIRDNKGLNETTKLHRTT